MTGGRTGGGEESRARRGTTRELAAATAWEDSRKKEEAATRGELALADRTARQHRRRAKKKDYAVPSTSRPTLRWCTRAHLPSSRLPPCPKQPHPVAGVVSPSPQRRHPTTAPQTGPPHAPTPAAAAGTRPGRHRRRARTTLAVGTTTRTQRPWQRGVYGGRGERAAVPHPPPDCEMQLCAPAQKNRACGTPFESSGDLTRPHGESVQSQTSSSKN